MPAFWKVGAIVLLWLLTASFSFVYAARSISITADKSSLFGEEEVTITASPSGFTDGEAIYVKGAFYQDGSTNYFGFTKNGDVWVKNSASNTNQRMITIGDWDGTLNVKSDFSDSGYKGEGDYKIRVRFYWGGTSSADWSDNILSISLSEPDPTPTNSPVPTNTPTSTPQPTATHAPTPTSNTTHTPTKKPTNTLIPKQTDKKTPTSTEHLSEIGTSSGQNNQEGDIYGAKDDSTATSSITMERTPSNKVFIITFLFIGIGCALLSLALVLRKQFFST